MDGLPDAVSRVVFVAHTPEISGAEKVLLDLIGAALHTGRSVLLACPDGPLAQRVPDGCEYLPIAPLGLSGETGGRRLLGAARLLARWVSTGRALAPVLRPPGTATVVNSMFALPAVRVARPPNGAAWLVHDTVTSTKQKAVTAMARPVVRRAVAVSEATAAPLRRMGLPTVVAHNGVRLPLPALDGPPHVPPVVGMLALLTPWKGHRVLLDALRELPGVHAELAGGSFPSDADYVTELEERATAGDLAGRVRFLGHVNSTEALAGWDLMVSASISPEAGPLSVLEAMACGVPVVGTDHGGTSEFLRDGAGVLVAPGDSSALAGAIGRVLADGTSRRQLIDVARRRVAAEHDLAVTLPEMLTALLS